jgi:hypothetical protein
MRRVNRRSIAAALVALSCGSCSAGSGSAGSGSGRAVDAPGRTEAAASVEAPFSACKVREKSLPAGVEHFVECERGIYQVLTVTDPEVLRHPDAELLDLAVSQSGRETERGRLTFAGSEHEIRRYRAGEPDAERPALAGLVAIHREPKRLLVLHCISPGYLKHAMDDRECASKLGAIVKGGISPAAVQSTAAAEANARIEIDGFALDLPSCRRPGPDNVKCDNGQLSWRATPELAQAEALVDSEVARLTAAELAAQGGRVEGDHRPGCTFLERPARCRQLDLYLGSQALGTLRVFLISTRTATGGLFAACSYFPAQEPGEGLPLPCSKVLELTAATGS